MLAAAVMLLVVGAVTVTGRVVAMVHPSPVVVAATPRVSDLQFAGAAQSAALDYLSLGYRGPSRHADGGFEPVGLRRGDERRMGWLWSARRGERRPRSGFAHGDDRAVVTSRSAPTPTPQVEPPRPGSNDSNWPGAGSADVVDGRGTGRLARPTNCSDCAAGVDRFATHPSASAQRYGRLRTKTPMPAGRQRRRSAS